MRSDRGERRLLLGFGALVALTVAIGLMSILQIHSFATIIRVFGQHHLPIERAILEMKTSNTLYALRVRNYVVWRTSRYLPAAPIASELGATERSLTDFRQALASYTALVSSPQERLWAKRLEESADDAQRMGREIIELADIRGEPNKEPIDRLLLTFENSVSKVDNLLTDTLSKRNLEAIAAHLRWADDQRRTSLVALALSVSCSIMLGIGIARFVYTSLKQERRLRERLVQRMITMEEEERKNLSRQLHDQLSQDLSALKIYLGLIAQELPAELTEPMARLEKSKQILGSLIERGHNISELLRPSELDEMGLVDSVAALVAQQQEITGARYEFRRPSAELTLPSEHSLVLYRAAQEALTNIAKHARATRITVSLEQQQDTVRLVVADNGVGFNYETLLKQPRRRKDDTLKLGLLGLRERVEFLDGRFRIETAPGKGTNMLIELTV